MNPLRYFMSIVLLQIFGASELTKEKLKTKTSKFVQEEDNISKL